jgi:GTP-binding protein
MSLPDHHPTPPLKDWIHQIAFITSAARCSDLEISAVAEIAIAGRSNAGKSSALNCICGRKRLAFSSKTPGRTQLINLFGLRLQDSEIGRLVDLPGYGYAAVDRTTKSRWQMELSRFLEIRDSLVGLMLVMDVRHPFGPLDIQMLQWFGRRGRPIHILLTKADKLGRQEQARTLAAARKTIGDNASQWGGQLSVSLFSATTRQGREEALAKIAEWWGIDEKKHPTSDSSGGNA